MGIGVLHDWVGLVLVLVVVIGEVSLANSGNVGLKRVGADSQVSKGYEVPVRSPMSTHQLAIQVVPHSHEQKVASKADSFFDVSVQARASGNRK